MGRERKGRRQGKPAWEDGWTLGLCTKQAYPGQKHINPCRSWVMSMHKRGARPQNAQISARWRETPLLALFPPVCEQSAVCGLSYVAQAVIIRSHGLWFACIIISGELRRFCRGRCPQDAEVPGYLAHADPHPGGLGAGPKVPYAELPISDGDIIPNFSEKHANMGKQNGEAEVELCEWGSCQAHHRCHWISPERGTLEIVTIWVRTLQVPISTCYTQAPMQLDAKRPDSQVPHLPPTPTNAHAKSIEIRHSIDRILLRGRHEHNHVRLSKNKGQPHPSTWPQLQIQALLSSPEARRGGWLRDDPSVPSHHISVAHLLGACSPTTKEVRSFSLLVRQDGDGPGLISRANKWTQCRRASQAS
jgi:hypothetical protein